MIKKIHHLIKEFEIGILEILVGSLMLIGLLGYFWKVPADLDWIDHTVSFILFSLLFYRISITAILFGKRNKHVDAIIVLSYFLFFFKDILLYTSAVVEELHFLRFISLAHYYLVEHDFLINFLPFFLASIGIILASVFTTFKLDIESPSLLNALIPKKLRRLEFKSHIRKFTIIFLFLLAFYYFVYNTILEWLEFTMDDPIIFIGILFFIQKIHKHKEKLHKEDFIFKITEFSESIYRRFISLFHYRKTIFLGISGIIVLHLLSDLGIYVLSYTTWINNIYIEYLGEGHTKLIKLLAMDISANNPIWINIGITWIYIFNLIAIISLLLIPVFLWVSLFKQKELKLNRYLLSLILTSYFIYLIYPTFAIKSISSKNFVGVDIVTFSFLEKPHLPEIIFAERNIALIFTILISIILLFLVLLLSLKNSLSNKMLGITILISLVFVGYYIYRFFQSQFIYFVNNIIFFIKTYQIFFAIMFIIILFITLVFYFLGYFTFIYEVGHEYHNKKWSKVIDKDLKIVMRKIEDYEKRKVVERILD